MPELPEVETVRRQLDERMAGKTIKKMTVRRSDLREPIARNTSALVSGNKVLDIGRRAKYILIGFGHGTLVVHLGMSGTIRADAPGSKPIKHDHVEFLTAGCIMRYNDPRRFGRMFWSEDPMSHPLLANAGIEPLERGFSAASLAQICAGKKTAIKQLLMDGSKIAGVGNIYASEALFLAKVRPHRAAMTISRDESAAIVKHVKSVLRKAIKAGGSTLRNHAMVDGKPGYFQVSHKVYGKEGEPCLECSTPITRTVIGNRATFHCESCQR